MLKAIVIDDEERARRLIANLLEEYCQEVEVVAKCENVPDAVIKINELKPDVVFCDIEMPDYNGFDLLSFFSTIEFELVFATGYSEYAIKAFEVSAVDYILKPIQIEALKSSIEKVRQKRNVSTIHERMQVLKENIEHQDIQKIALPVSDGLVFIDIHNIAHIEADRAYSNVHLASGKTILVSKRLKLFEELLADKKQFFRAHRSSLINISFIKKYVRAERIIVLDNNQLVNLAREKKSEFESYIQHIRL